MKKVDFNKLQAGDLGVISKEEYEIEMKSVQLLEQALANYSVY